MKRTTFIIIALVLGLTATFFFIRRTRSLQANYFNQASDQIVRPQIQPLTQTLKLTGSIDAQAKSDLHFNTPGLMTWVGVRVGDKVKRYQAIASLDQRQLQKQLQREANNYQSSLSSFLDTENKYQSVKDKALVTDEIKRILERNQNNLNNAVISYELAELAKRLSVLTTPIAGIVTQVDQPYSGVNVSSLDIFQVVDPSSLYFTTQLDQEDLSKIRLGQPALITIDSYPDDSINTSVSYISFTPITGQSNIVYEVRFNLADLDNQDLKYRLGLTGDATVTVASQPQTLTLPLEAVNSQNGQNFVWTRLGDNKLVQTPIDLGLETDELVEVKKGLSVNDQVVIRQSQ